MKTDIHPKYFPNATAKCACGAVFNIGSTKEKIEVEICSQCHPFYTGNEKVIDSAGRVEKFKVRQAKKSPVKKTVKKPKEAASEEK
ncbi:MAG: 50S ribosomal protein L31 [Candidatus Taylorbacteria bacterium RIFCSPLOWO2_12_FULL_43_20]|uniref:Large ribosomal subunit protein bL31 n=1 Tax=Candidatus Taylorbacteria bacterium RIFCSPLOWO2_12_FULL_43_20 TaxID=1802332 RepID=A0A1G2P4Z8_9BACT|nr:MAG: 50S ribosomal protein L31 [Candidatus Taylorbacteria bacterium RIFCSPHIGHO2_01_FULL_43_120]OHA22048.1 MAG: 50S ribosomal protein L31 [Candidatus Taylorbacteria bacterium RIFCSPHIGHO2_02_FULL_43_55]OHA30373.1 MAG: 50S ribosomal protein L31 [Candidatus Taylorbacteria bacterium RIFCSPHIGHO2_12_FULL_42_34]OHA31545.1 MAG: 50S ribosomal protein L31 [Candidatus Taylorbacteria bacterium RIFCSPLOWO2_01_FULL_43_83]OHA39743.1 MAG: 50S ribosomal protein L31 [Candidatus Taylorbacteria bacterium RIFC